MTTLLLEVSWFGSPNERYTNTILKASVAVYRNVFAHIFDINNYESETRLQTKCATYAEIRSWVKKNYGLHISNLAISWTTDHCGLAKTSEKEHMGLGEPYQVI